MARTRQELSDFLGVAVSPEQFREHQARRLRNAVPPFRMEISCPPVDMTEQEIAQAEYNDDMGIMVEPDLYRVLRAQDLETAKAEAERIWRSERHDDDATGYAIYSSDWGCRHVMTADDRMIACADG